MAVDLTVSNLLRASPTRSSKRLESFFQLQVRLFLPFPALLPLSRFNAANIVFPHLQTSIALVCRVISLERFWSSLQRTCIVIGYFVGDQPMRKFVAHTVVGSRKIVLGCWVGRLRRGVVCTQRGGGGGGLLIALGDRQTDLYNCTLILSQAVGFTISPQSHAHGPARDLKGSTPLLCGWDRASSAMLLPYVMLFMTYIFRHCGFLILKITSIQAQRKVERESVCA